MSDLEGQPIEGECAQILDDYFLCPMRFGYKKYRGVVMPSSHSKMAERIENFEVRDDDIWIISFPKTGTTWSQEMAWCIAKDLDFEAAKEPLQSRFPFLDHTSLFDYTELTAKHPDFVLPDFAADSISYLDKLPSPRFIKSHFQWQLLPTSIRNGTRKPKIIYVCRDAKDTCISYYHHSVLLEGYTGSFEDFCKLFVNDCVTFSPFWPHVTGFWHRRNDSNVLFLRYEDMKKDLASVIRQTGDFLGKNLTQDQVDQLCEHLSFKSMKENPSVNYETVVDIHRKYKLIPESGEFMRQGGTGGEWKSKMTNDIIEQFDEWTAQNKDDFVPS